MVTPEENAVLERLAEAYCLFTRLPALHPSDAPEFTGFVHGAQNLILARSGFRALHPDTVLRRTDLRLREAGDRRDWDECDRLEGALREAIASSEAPYLEDIAGA